MSFEPSIWAVHMHHRFLRSQQVWYMHNLLKYEFDLEFDLPVGYPATAPELALPELDGKTEKM